MAGTVTGGVSGGDGQGGEGEGEGPVLVGGGKGEEDVGGSLAGTCDGGGEMTLQTDRP